MSDRFPLILNTSTNQIQEIASGDTLDLTGNNIKGVGIITATTISGTLSGIATLARGLTDIPSINVTNITGVGATFSGAIDANGDLDVDGHTNLDNISISGVTTTTGVVVINGGTQSTNPTSGALRVAGGAGIQGNVNVGGDLDVDGHTNLDNVSIAGVTTIATNTTIGGNLTVNGTNTILNTTTYVQGGEGADGILAIYADEGDDNNDKWRLRAGANAAFYIDNYANGAWQTNLAATATSTQLYSAGYTKVNTTTNGINVYNGESGGTTTINVTKGSGDAEVVCQRTGGSGIKLRGSHPSSFLETTTDSDLNIRRNTNTRIVLGSSGNTIYGNTTFQSGITGTTATFSGNVSVGGVLTYEDVTNVDSVGIVTARTGLKVLAGGANVVGISTFSDDVKVGSGVTITPAGAGFFAGIVTASSFVQRDGSPVGGVVSDSDGNTAAGSNAGANFTSGQALNNTLFGLNAGNDITTGDLNVAVGKDTLDACDAGTHNTAVGSGALGALTGGVENTAVGYGAGGGNAANMTKNVFMGYYAGRSITSNQNTVMGYEAGKANNTSGSLVAFGFEAAHNSQNSGRLTAIGYQAGKSHWGGNGNTYVGYQAGHLNGAGDRNVVVGDLSVSGSSDYNRVTVIGASAAGGFGSNANDNTVVGYNAGSSTLTGTNNVIIGSGANLSGNVSNEITLGNANITRFRIPGIGVDLTGPIGITTEQVTPSSNVATLNLAKDDHKIVASGTYTIDVSGGTEAGSHTLRIENSGTANVGFSTYFKFPSGGTPSLPTASGAISLISFSVHKVGSVGIATVLLAGASVNFS